MAKLTAAWIARTKDAGNYSDGNGLMLVVGKTGNTKTWKFKTRLVVNGKPKNFDKKIGGYPAMSLSEARELALAIKSAYQNGIDYFADLEKATQQADKDAITFQQIADEWLSIKQAKGMRANTLDTDKKRLDKHILPNSEGSDYVFPSAKRNGKTPHRNKETANTALKLRLKYKDRLTAHGLHHTAATALGKLGYDRDLIDTALSHLVGNEVSRTYNKDKAIKQRREMLNHWSEYLTNIA